MAVTEWNGDRLERMLLDAADAGVGAAAEVVVTQAKINLSNQGRDRQARKGKKIVARALRSESPARELFRLIGRNPETGRLRQSSGRGVQIKKGLDLLRNGNVDAPGGFPRLITGFLRRSIKAGFLAGEAPVKGERWVGSTMDYKTGYAASQEFGSPKLNLPARPYIRPAFNATLAAQASAFESASKRVMESAIQ